MTYHTYSPALGYVQGECHAAIVLIPGMSDLLSPVYVVFDANEGDAFWGLVGLMKMMVSAVRCRTNPQESNFLRDQSGMKRQLSTLQQLIGVMDPELYAHLGGSQRPRLADSRPHRQPQLVLLLPVDPHLVQARVQV
jgi:hypothetical protein